MSEAITSFRGQYGFLSNFHICPIVYDGLKFTSSEALYQAGKCKIPSERILFQSMSPGHSKRAGRRVTMISNFDEVKITWMCRVLDAKFSQNLHLANLLEHTGQRELIEGNTWHDYFWGVCNGTGENHLGKLLMELRASLRE